MDYEQIKDRLEKAEELLSEARSIMDDVHLYNSSIFKEIGIFLNGEEEEE